MLQKMKKIAIILFVNICFMSCEDNSKSENTLEGKWNVTQIIGGFAQPVNYEEGSFTWTFNFDNKTVTIVNISQPFDTLYSPTFINNRGGNYSFEIVTENNIDYLIVEGRKGTIIFTKTGLTIDYGIAFDDIAYIFKR
jgi:hypothetical protein